MHRVAILLLLVAGLPAGLQAQDPPPDPEEAPPLCRYRMSLTCTQRSVEIEDDYEHACNAGDLVFCTVAGLIWETGASGVRNVPEATRLYRRSCDRGVLSACRRLELLRSDAQKGEDFDPYSRVGFVADAYDGTPIQGATVSVRMTGQARVSNEAGRIEFERLPRGNHTVRVTHPGYTTAEGTLPVPWESDFLILMEEETDIEAVEAMEAEDSGRVFGQITVEGVGDGIADVAVTAVDSEGFERTLITDSNGRFSLDDMAPGPVQIEFEHIGYGLRQTTVDLAPGQMTEVYASMSSTPIPLEPIEVVVASGYLQRSGFFRRAQRGLGQHFTRRDIMRLDPMEVSDLMVRIPGVTISRGIDGANVFTRRRSSLDAGACRMRPYLDGTRLVDWNLDQVRPNDLEGVEVFQGPEVPIEYQRPIAPGDEPECGVVLIWTRDPR